MSRPESRRRFAAAMGPVVALLTACAPTASTPVTVPATASPDPAHSALRPTITLAAATATFSAATSTALPAGTPGVAVKVAALGNVYIRRGPDLAFNPIGSLLEGQVITATGRDVLSKWLRVPLPGDTLSYGWISIMSEFTDVQGDLGALPESDPMEWPELAFLRNCTFHEMWIQPIGLTLPPVYEFPNNELRFNPGSYSVLDVELDGYPEVLKAELREGMVIDILVDGLGEKTKCPPP